MLVYLEYIRTCDPISNKRIVIVAIVTHFILTFYHCSFVAYVGYYGLSLAIGNLAGDIYLNFLISVVVEFFAYLMCIILFDKVGHRRFHIGCLIIGGTASLGAVVTSFLIKNCKCITILLEYFGNKYFFNRNPNTNCRISKYCNYKRVELSNDV